MKILTRTAAAVLAAVEKRAGGLEAGLRQQVLLGVTGSGSCFRSGHQQYQLHCR